MDLLRLGLERARDRHEAVEVIVALLERHGQGGSCSHEHPRFTYDNSFLVADPDGAVVLETAGRQWATEEVTGRGSRDLQRADHRGVRARHADPVRGRVARCAVRRERTTAAAERAKGVADMIAALRDHGGPAPLVPGQRRARARPAPTPAAWSPPRRAPPPGWRTCAARPTHWVTGTSAPCTGLFRPIRVDDPLPEDPVDQPVRRPARRGGGTSCSTGWRCATTPRRWSSTATSGTRPSGRGSTHPPIRSTRPGRGGPAGPLVDRPGGRRGPGRHPSALAPAAVARMGRGRRDAGGDAPVAQVDQRTSSGQLTSWRTVRRMPSAGAGRGPPGQDEGGRPPGEPDLVGGALDGVHDRVGRRAGEVRREVVAAEVPEGQGEHDQRLDDPGDADPDQQCGHLVGDEDADAEPDQRPQARAPAG